MNQYDAISKLQDSRNLRSRQEIAEFYEALDLLESKFVPDILVDLFLVFSDEVNETHGLQSLQTHIESYPADLFISALFKATPQLLKQAPEWLNLFYLSVLNNEQDMPLLEEQYKHLNPDLKTIVKKVLDDLKISIEEFNDEVWRQEIRKKIDSVINSS